MLIFLLFNYHKILLCDNSDNQIQHNLFIELSREGINTCGVTPEFCPYFCKMVLRCSNHSNNDHPCEKGYVFNGLVTYTVGNTH